MALIIVPPRPRAGDPGRTEGPPKNAKFPARLASRSCSSLSGCMRAMRASSSFLPPSSTCRCDSDLRPAAHQRVGVRRATRRGESSSPLPALQHVPVRLRPAPGRPAAAGDTQREGAQNNPLLFPALQRVLTGATPTCACPPGSSWGRLVRWRMAGWMSQEGSTQCRQLLLRPLSLQSALRLCNTDPIPRQAQRQGKGTESTTAIPASPQSSPSGSGRPGQ